MDTFTAIVVAGIVVALAVFLGLGLLTRGRPLAEVTDRRANEKWATQLQIEQADLPQMLESANAYRRRRGLPEVTAEQLGAMVEAEQIELLRQARARGGRASGSGRERERRGF
jgi:hypothetical protein